MGKERNTMSEITDWMDSIEKGHPDDKWIVSGHSIHEVTSKGTIGDEICEWNYIDDAYFIVDARNAGRKAYDMVRAVMSIHQAEGDGYDCPTCHVPFPCHTIESMISVVRQGHQRTLLKERTAI